MAQNISLNLSKNVIRDGECVDVSWESNVRSLVCRLGIRRIRLIEGEMTFADVDGILHNAVDIVGMPAHIVRITPSVYLRAEALVLAFLRSILQS